MLAEKLPAIDRDDRALPAEPHAREETARQQAVLDARLRASARRPRARPDDSRRALTRLPGQHWVHDWSRDGRRSLYAARRDGLWNVYWMDVETGTLALARQD